MTSTLTLSDTEKLARKRKATSARSKKWRRANPEYAAKWRANNREKTREYSRKWREKTPEYREADRRSYIKRTYGITQEEWDAMFERQGNVCAICKTETSGPREWNTDHCHESGAVRGVLCHYCNIGLGNFRDNPATLLSAVEYLNGHNGQQKQN